MYANPLFQKSITAITDLKLEEIWQILQFAELIKNSGQEPQSLRDRIIAHAFFEPSTRTRLSFEAAALRLGGQVIGFSDSHSTSAKKGESLEDTIQVLSLYADAIVLRHFENFAAARALKVSQVPIINAGDGSNEHPTQTLLDLFTILETQGRLENLQIGLVGDLKYSRTIHSLLKALCLFGTQVFYVLSPDYLSLPQEVESYLKSAGCEVVKVSTMAEMMAKLNILYMTRLQKERFPTDLKASLLNEQFQNCCLQQSDLDQVKPHFKILHPLPRLEEIPVEIDSSPYAYYFQQAENGLFVRQAILHSLFAPTTR